MSPATAPQFNDVREKILATGQRIMGAKGFSAVGLNEILSEASVPKGSFYHYFGSKEAFGEAMLESYFEDYLADIAATFREPGLKMSQRLINYFESWHNNQSFLDCQGKCLAVKLGAEVADLSESMRTALQRGTAEIIRRLADAIEAGVSDGSVTVDQEPRVVAQSLYQLWLGASIMAKIVRNTGPFEQAMTTTRQTLHLSP
ncbi:TetR/AcrR family transcriptional repressor of nem operon [Luteibacter sp. Sphag1AF]|uniref:TetR/AcrR family transcriptional regulator n=1 Tax=Luteibacter sp. Sphag1AF TaxID=2587031 RepID=UPI00160AC2D0|nr:TetR/AcrR family transcriptional regulator [Luteibacter sp. Sphag1AF]MBB3228125.1 TetR/AcrR family transcriptional repressor of nem operon [Luteibacter sp. Sphag1AF]